MAHAEAEERTFIKLIKELPAFAWPHHFESFELMEILHKRKRLIRENSLITSFLLLTLSTSETILRTPYECYS